MDLRFFEGSDFLTLDLEPTLREWLAGLYDEAGDRERALAHYRRFAETWVDADPDLQPRVEHARQRAEALSSGP